MITKIENGIVTVSAYGFAPGKYPIEEFTAEDMLEERRILDTYRQAHPVSCDLFRKLDDQIARLIDYKCIVEKINKLTHYEMAKLWRFAEAGHIYFNTTMPYYKIFQERFEKFGGMTPEMSKQIGLEE